MKEQTAIRIRRLKKSLSARRIETALITAPENRFYLSGFLAEDIGLTESAGALLITRQECFLLTDGRYEVQAKQQAPGFNTVIYKKGLISSLKPIFQDMELHSCAYEPDYISCRRFHELRNSIPGISWHDIGNTCEKMRLIKDNEECSLIIKAQQAAEAVFKDVLPMIQPGKTEKEIAFTILQGLYTKADGPSFPPIVASGPNSALPHAVPENRKIRKGEPVIVDMGARIQGYCSDMTRTVFCGRPSARFQDIYMVVKEAQRTAQEAIRPGMTGKEADHIARKVIENAGFGNRFVHSLGHGVGIAIHEPPMLSTRSRKRLRPGMVFTVEPGIYLPGEGGVRLENMGILQDNGLEIMTSNKWFYEF